MNNVQKIDIQGSFSQIFSTLYVCVPPRHTEWKCFKCQSAPLGRPSRYSCGISLGAMYHFRSAWVQKIAIFRVKTKQKIFGSFLGVYSAVCLCLCHKLVGATISAPANYSVVHLENFGKARYRTPLCQIQLPNAHAQWKRNTDLLHPSSILVGDFYTPPTSWCIGPSLGPGFLLMVQ